MRPRKKARVLKVATPPKFKKQKIAKRDSPEEWLRVMVVMPIGVKPLWDEIQQKLRAFELVHHNDAIEAGMHVEALLAEFYAGTQIPRPEGWTERVD